MLMEAYTHMETQLGVSNINSPLRYLCDGLFIFCDQNLYLV